MRNISSIGVRKESKRVYDEATADGNLVITTRRFKRLGPQAAIDLVPASENLYVTVDIDVLDPAHAPGTGAPEVWGPLLRGAARLAGPSGREAPRRCLRHGGGSASLRPRRDNHHGGLEAHRRPSERGIPTQALTAVLPAPIARRERVFLDEDPDEDPCEQTSGWVIQPTPSF